MEILLFDFLHVFSIFSRNIPLYDTKEEEEESDVSLSRKLTTHHTRYPSGDNAKHSDGTSESEDRRLSRLSLYENVSDTMEVPEVSIKTHKNLNLDLNLISLFSFSVVDNFLFSTKTFLLLFRDYHVQSSQSYNHYLLDLVKSTLYDMGRE
jgi:hypothetical protein